MHDDSFITQSLLQLAADVPGDSDRPDDGESVVPTLELKQMFDVDASDESADRSDSMSSPGELGPATETT